LCGRKRSPLAIELLNISHTRRIYNIWNHPWICANLVSRSFFEEEKVTFLGSPVFTSFFSKELQTPFTLIKKADNKA
jgi:hypothetical protein